MQKINVLELFAGIGAFSKALDNLGIESNILDAVEIDKYAVKSFNAIHGTNFAPQDITKWDKTFDCPVDIIMHGSPCQDFSIAGKGAGGDKDSGTRSSLLYETLRIVEKLKPKVVIWENVKNLLSTKHRHNFDAYLEAMAELGYHSNYKVLNAKDYGIPQNRERVFTVSIRKDLEDSFMRFEFPEPIPLQKKLKDMLENEVDEKYFISENMMNYFMGVNQKPSKYPRKERFLANINRKDQDRANTITTAPGQRPTDNFIKIRTANKQGYDLATEGDGIDLQYPTSTTHRGRVGHKISKTIMTGDGNGVVVKNNLNATRQSNMAIRKLTPKECWRLMGFDDIDIEKAQKAGLSNTQLYKQAGNSIVVNCIQGIIGKVLGAIYEN